MRLWPDSLAGRTLALLIGTTLLLILGSAVLLQDERSKRFDEHNRFRHLERVATLARLLSDANEHEQSRIIKRISEEHDDISLTPLPRIDRQPRDPMEKKIAHHLRRSLHLKSRSAIRVRIDFDQQDKTVYTDERDHHPLRRPLKSIHISVRLKDQTWLNFSTKDFKNVPPWESKTLQLLFLYLVLLITSGLLIARRMANPMAQLAEAAERFGLGQPQSPIPEKGPREVRKTIHAFNLMQERLEKQISDRSRLLAAVSHDLKTPITTLRLRAEYIEDTEMQEKTLATLTEMEAILSDTLSYARDEAADEQARNTDLAALMQSLVDDHADLGGETSYQGPERLNFICRPVALRRAFNNLIDNALKYGGSAVATLTSSTEHVIIDIEDSGPGIEEQYLDAVLAPFFRLEGSRNRETGGTGLGLAVANSIVLGHGGELSLSNRSEGGLRVRVILNKLQSTQSKSN
ncbi:MAG: ATP-binding protein [Candidatus Thiodiazotropha sp. DIVDIV]